MDLIMWHHAYSGHHFAVYHDATYHGEGLHPAMGSWLGHSIVSAVIHGLIYGAIFHMMRGMSAGEALLVAILGIAVVGGGWWLWSCRR